MRKNSRRGRNNCCGSSAIEALVALGLLSMVAAGTHKLLANQIKCLRLAENNFVEKNTLAAKLVEDSLEKFHLELQP